MKPIDLRNETFDSLKARLEADRLAAHRAWLAHGPGTTREISAKAGLELLTFRPRSTELYQIGVLELLERQGHEGVYRARTIESWEAWFATHRNALITGQQQLL